MNMKVVYLILYLFTNYISLYSAEIIENISINEKSFGDWTVSCEQDVMMDNVDCKIFTKFYNNTSSVYIQPNNKIANQVVIMIPSVLPNTTVKVKIDKNEIITSDIITNISEYGVIPFSPRKQKTMLSQLKKGNELFIRFSVRDLKSVNGMKEITTKISLFDFQKMLVYYDIKMDNSSLNKK